MSKRRSKRSVDSRPRATPPVPKPAVHAMPGRYVRWRNETGRSVEGEIGGAKIEGWTPGLTRSVPESLSADAEAVGLTCMGYVQ